MDDGLRLGLSFGVTLTCEMNVNIITHKISRVNILMAEKNNRSPQLNLRNISKTKTKRKRKRKRKRDQHQIQRNKIRMRIRFCDDG